MVHEPRRRVMTAAVNRPREFSHAVLVALALLARVAVAGQPAPNDVQLGAFENTLTDLVQEVEPTVVSIARVRAVDDQRPPSGAGVFPLDPVDDLDRHDDPKDADFVPNEFGTGVIVAGPPGPTSRLILTNYHVVRGGPVARDEREEERPVTSRLFVYMSDHRHYEATIHAADPRSDLAVLTVDFEAVGKEPADIPAIRLGQADAVKKGQPVLIFGNPYAIARDGSASVSWGIIANRARRFAPVRTWVSDEARNDETIHHFGTLFQIDSRINLGASGGAVVDLKGSMVALTTARAALDGYERSAGFAIPLDRGTRRILDSLIAGFEVEYGFLGIEPRNVPFDELRRLPIPSHYTRAAKADVVFSNSPASRGGLKPDDLILQIGDHPVYGRSDLMREIAQLGPAATANLTIWRPSNQKRLQLSIVLGKWPVFDDIGIIATRDRHPLWRGLKVDFPTARRRYLQRPVRQYHDAVLVTRITPRTPAAVTELRVGDFIATVNDKPVRTPDEFQRAASSLSGDVRLKLTDGRRIVIKE